MPRPFPWLSRLYEIRRTVKNSVRSHYSRRELEILFKVSGRSAGRLLELLATEPIGTSHVVAREILANFLDQVRDAENVPALCERIRGARENLTRAKARYMVLRDELEVPAYSLPRGVRLEPGCLTVRFESVEEMCASLHRLALAMQDDPLAIEALCEPEKQVSAEAQEARWYREETERLAREQHAA